MSPRRDVRLLVTNTLPGLPSLTSAASSWVTLHDAAKLRASKEPSSSAHSFPFSIPLSLDAPCCLHLEDSDGGELRWELEVRVSQVGASEVCETHLLHLLPYDLTPGPSNSGVSTRITEEAVASRMFSEGQSGFEVRLVMAHGSIRSGQSSLRLGVEIRKTGDRNVVASKLRAIRRVKVEWWRVVELVGSQGSSSQQGSTGNKRTLLYHSGKGCRFSESQPVRLLFEVPPISTTTCGFITQTTVYHSVRFFVRAIVGFAGNDNEDVVVEKELVVEKPLWTGAIEIESEPIDPSLLEEANPVDDEIRHQAYRLKGLDIVGEQGTYRHSTDPELPSFGGSSNAAAGPSTESGLPTFTESQRLSTAQGAASSSSPTAYLSGELATWVECDGYETFSEPPPSAMASVGASGSMDLPSNGRPDASEQLRLVEALGLGQGTRVIDTEEDMPPSIDEPSLPALPNAILPHHHVSAHPRRYSTLPPEVEAVTVDAAAAAPVARSSTRSNTISGAPPTFAASEAAERQGLAATGPIQNEPQHDEPEAVGDLPPPPSYTTGPPPLGAPPGYA